MRMREPKDDIFISTCLTNVKEIKMKRKNMKTNLKRCHLRDFSLN